MGLGWLEKVDNNPPVVGADKPSSCYEVTMVSSDITRCYLCNPWCAEIYKTMVTTAVYPEQDIKLLIFKVFKQTINSYPDEA